MPENQLNEGSLIPAQRHQIIQQYLVVHQIASCPTLAKLLEVSESTVRRDLEWMESQGILERTRGGAILSQRIRAEAEYIQRAGTHAEEKRLIGIKAASLIKEGDFVFINSGTTTAQVIKHIRNIANITVITNNTSALIDAHDIDYELVILGGTFLPLSNAVVSLFSTDNLNQIYATKSIIGVEGISLKFGCTVSTHSEAEIIRLMIEHTQGPVIIATDHSKWGAVSNHLIARVDQIQYLVTDKDFDIDGRIALASRSVEILIAGITALSES